MYIIYLIFILNSFISTTSCELINEPLVITYRNTDKFNMFLKVINIPENVVQYGLKSFISNKYANVISHGQVNGEYVKIFVNTTGITVDQNYSLELWKAHGSLCSSRDVCHIIVKDVLQKKGTIDKHKCLIQVKACQIQIDFRNQCDAPTFGLNNATDTQTWDQYFRSSNVIIWLVPVLVAALVTAGVITCVLKKYFKYKNRPTESQQHTHVSPTEVIYAEINPQSHRTPDKPMLTHEEEPYATVIGVLEKDKLYPDAVSLDNLHLVKMFAPSTAS